jgi:hypothetical protein
MTTQKAQKRGVETRQQLSREQRGALLSTLKARFEKHINRHQGLQWTAVQARLEANPESLYSLNEMERTGGEPDVVGHDKKTASTSSTTVQRKAPKAAQCVLRPGSSGGKKGTQAEEQRDRYGGRHGD